MEPGAKALIHPDAVKAFDEQGEELLAHVVAREPTAPGPDPGIPHVVAVASISLEDLRDFTTTQTSPDGTILSKFRRLGDREVGLAEAGYHELRILTEKIQRTEGLRVAVSQTALEDVVYQWVLDRHVEASSQRLAERVTAEFSCRVRPLWVWVPVSGLATQFDFDLGNVTIHPFRPAFFDTWTKQMVAHGVSGGPPFPIVERARTRLQGRAACTVRVCAEPIRARELALSEAESALAILRVFEPRMLHPLLPSHIVPLGREHTLGSEFLVMDGSDLAGVFAGTDEDAPWWNLDPPTMDMLSCGMGALHNLCRETRKSEFDADLWASILVYSRSSLQKSPEDRLIYVCRALESFALRDGSEPIQQNLSERMAFTVSSDGAERRKIVQTTKHVYSMRSDSVHHNKTIKEIERLTEFLQIAFRYFLLLIGRRRDYVSRSDYFADIEKLKYA